jgi:hypothetical protein
MAGINKELLDKVRNQNVNSTPFSDQLSSVWKLLSARRAHPAIEAGLDPSQFGSVDEMDSYMKASQPQPQPQPVSEPTDPLKAGPLVASAPVDSATDAPSSLVGKVANNVRSKKDTKRAIADEAGIKPKDINDKNLLGAQSIISGEKAPSDSGGDSMQRKIALAIIGLAPALAGFALGGDAGGAAGGAIGSKAVGDIVVGEEKLRKEALEKMEKESDRDVKKAHIANESRNSDTEAKYKMGMLEVERAKLKGEKAGKTLAAEQADKLGAHDASLKLLNDLKTAYTLNKNVTGPIAGRFSAANPYNTDAQALQALTKSAAQNIGKSLEGGKLTDQDIARYEKMLPTMKDTPEVQAAKIEQLQRMVLQRRGSDLDSFGKAGYNVSSFQAIDPGNAALLTAKTKGGGNGSIPGIPDAQAESWTPDKEKRLQTLRLKQKNGMLGGK